MDGAEDSDESDNGLVIHEGSSGSQQDSEKPEEETVQTRSSRRKLLTVLNKASAATTRQSSRLLRSESHKASGVLATPSSTAKKESLRQDQQPTREMEGRKGRADQDMTTAPSNDSENGKVEILL